MLSMLKRHKYRVVTTLPPAWLRSLLGLPVSRSRTLVHEGEVHPLFQKMLSSLLYGPCRSKNGLRDSPKAAKVVAVDVREAN